MTNYEIAKAKYALSLSPKNSANDCSITPKKKRSVPGSFFLPETENLSIVLLYGLR